MHLREIRIWRIALLMAAGCVLGFALLTAAYCLPAEPMKQNLRKTADTFLTEGNRPQVIPTYPGSTGDGYTDALMLTEAIFDDPQISPLRKAIYVYRRAGSESASADLGDLLEGNRDMPWVISYERYWHGYLVFLRPLLLIFNYGDLRMLMCTAQVLLFALIVVLLCRRGMPELVVPFAAAVLTLSPMGTMLSLQYFSVYAVAMLGMLAVLCLDAQLCRGARYIELFVLLGMLTSYLDFLTYPLATLGLPLLLVLYRHTGGRGLLRFAAAAAAAWVVGYLGFWALKWAAGSLLAQENLFMSAVYRVGYQTSTTYIGTNRWQVIAENLAAVCRPGYALLYTGSALACALPVLRRRGGGRRLLSGGRLLLLLVGLTPFIWWMAAANHSMDHAFFTYRLLAVTVFAVLAWLSSARAAE